MLGRIGTLILLNNADEMVQRRAAGYACNRYHNTGSITDMLNTLHWPSLQQRILKTRLIMFYKIVQHIVEVPSDLLIYVPTDNRARQIHPQTYRHLLTLKDCYKCYFFLFYMFDCTLNLFVKLR